MILKRKIRFFVMGMDRRLVAILREHRSDAAIKIIREIGICNTWSGYGILNRLITRVEGIPLQDNAD